jgi:hypothetical protein
MTLTALYAPVYASMCNTSTVSMVAVSYVSVTFTTAHIHSAQPVALATANRTLTTASNTKRKPSRTQNCTLHRQFQLWHAHAACCRIAYNLLPKQCYILYSSAYLSILCELCSSSLTLLLSACQFCVTLSPPTVAALPSLDRSSATCAVQLLS